MIKIIAVGDPHFKPDNIPEVNMFIEKMIKLIEKETPNLIVILGDLLHTHEKLYTVALNKAYEFVNEMRKRAEVILLVGNHDMCNNQQYLNENHWMNGMKEWKNITIADTIVSKKIENKLFIFSPYVPNGKFVEALNTCSEDWKEATAIFAHQEFFGCKMGAFDSVDGDKWDASFPNVISGHIHDNQKLGNVYYCGSSMQHSFGDSEKHIIPILTWENKKEYALTEVDLGLPKKKTIYQDVSNIDSLKLPESKDKIKVTVSGDYEEFKAFKQTKKYQDIVKSGTKVIFKPKKKEKTEKNIKEISESTDFKEILYKIIEKSESKKLMVLYRKFIN